ncbi:MAG: hypothetical protein L0216_00305 [Planctomycetales bacterium]|nr:hypothetical protein [Planctomycetales bacterium]
MGRGLWGRRGLLALLALASGCGGEPPKPVPTTTLRTEIGDEKLSEIPVYSGADLLAEAFRAPAGATVELLETEARTDPEDGSPIVAYRVRWQGREGYVAANVLAHGPAERPSQDR